MRQGFVLTSALAAVLSIGSLAGCAPRPVAAATDPSHPPVPALLPEEIPKPPVTADPLVWQPGHWDWTDTGYAWSAGQYVPAEGHGNLWMPGWWSHTADGWVWQPPHWLS
jgi:WXXGXW repeat (2 copies)